MDRQFGCRDWALSQTILKILRIVTLRSTVGTDWVSNPFVVLASSWEGGMRLQYFHGQSFHRSQGS